MAGRLILGTSGFSYEHWRGVFYPPDMSQARWLEAYAEHFSAVELNVTFYRLPAHSTFEDWARRTPADFEFVVKGSRLVTHYRRLKDVESALDALLEAADGLGPKLSCMLWQLPPRSAPDVAVLERFCALLAERSGRGRGRPRIRHAFEFRDLRWFSAEVIDVLRRRGFALVEADPPREGQVRDESADFGYLRFHHGPRPSGGYESEELAPYAARARTALAQGHDVYAFFNNDPGGWAPRNAEEFRGLVGEGVGDRGSDDGRQGSAGLELGPVPTGALSQ